MQYQRELKQDSKGKHIPLLKLSFLKLCLVQLGLQFLNLSFDLLHPCPQCRQLLLPLAPPRLAILLKLLRVV